MTFLTLKDALDYHGKKAQLLNKFENLVKEKDYQFIEPSYLEDYDFFTETHPMMPKNKMVKLIDSGGYIKLLRPDITTSIISEFIPKWKNNTLLKFYYHAATFKQTPTGIKENKQFGVELLGATSIDYDQEILTLIQAMFNAVKCDFILEVGHANFIKILLNELHLEKELKESLKVIINQKNNSELKRFVKKYLIDHPYQLLVERLFDLQGDISKILQLLQNINLPKSLLNVVEELKTLSSVINNDTFSFDLSIMSRYEYYSGIIYKGYSKKSPKALLKGGRYNTSLMGYKQSLSAIGFSLNLDDLLKEVLEDE